MDSSSSENSGTSGFSLFEMVVWAAVIVGIVLLTRHLAKTGASAPAVAAGTATVAFSPWFPLR